MVSERSRPDRSASGKDKMFRYFEVNAEGHNIRCKMYSAGKNTADKAVIF